MVGPGGHSKREAALRAAVEADIVNRTIETLVAVLEALHAYQAEQRKVKRLDLSLRPVALRLCQLSHAQAYVFIEFDDKTPWWVYAAGAIVFAMCFAFGWAVL